MSFKNTVASIKNFLAAKIANKKTLEIPVSQRLQETMSGVPMTGDTSYIPTPKSSSKALLNEKYAPLLVMLLTAWMIGDLISVKSRQYMIPTSQPPSKRINLDMAQYKPRSIYDDITIRNIFNSDGIIPELQVAKGEGGSFDTSGPARESALALNLIGTIVHANPGKSVATIEFKNTPDKVIPYIPNDDIEGMATLIKVERKRAYIRNLTSGAMEYIQIKDEPGISFAKKTAKQDGPITVEGDNQFAIGRNDLETQMSNLPERLSLHKIGSQRWRCD
jgi:hypothetical protein